MISIPSSRAKMAAIAELAACRALLKEACNLATEALTYAHGMPTIVDTMNDRIAAIREQGGV